MAENTIMKTMLFDFYGDLLTEKQREYYDLHYNDDLSLYEIAEQSGTSRQAVWDIIRRADAILQATEERTGFVAKAINRRAALEDIEARLRTLETEGTAKGAETLQSVLGDLHRLAD